MGIEGAIELGFSKELAEAVATSAEARQQLFDALVGAAYERGGALSVARTLETDEVIDPAESRGWVEAALDACVRTRGEPRSSAGGKRRRPCVSPW